MTKQQLDKLTGLRKKVQKSLDVISAERDKLRDHMSDIEDIAADIDLATECLGSAVNDIDEAVTTMSQRL